LKEECRGGAEKGIADQEYVENHEQVCAGKGAKILEEGVND